MPSAQIGGFGEGYRIGHDDGYRGSPSNGALIWVVSVFAGAVIRNGLMSLSAWMIDNEHEWPEHLKLVRLVVETASSAETVGFADGRGSAAA